METHSKNKQEEKLQHTRSHTPRVTYYQEPTVLSSSLNSNLQSYSIRIACLENILDFCKIKFMKILLDLFIY